VTDKFIGYFRLIEACEHAGCPVCACLEEDSRRALGTLLYEHVTDAETRHSLREAWGFCGWHAGAVLDGHGAATGAAILFEDLLRICQQGIERLFSRRPQRWCRPLSWLRRGVPRLAADYHSRRPCPICKTLDASEQSYLEAVGDFAEDPQFGRAYERSTGLCVPHVVRMVERCADGSGVDSIVHATLLKWQRLRRLLEGFVGKHEYRNAEPITEDEGMSWRLASEILAGRPSLFGNGMRANGVRRDIAVTPAGRSQPDPPADFAQRKLELRVQELTRQLSDESTRATALHYRLARVTEDRNTLELNLAGERGANALAQRALADVRAENERLRAELAAARDEHTPRARAR
jgi:Family of unknown function (DUF6062)